jgi:hypothetical protein
MKATIQKVTKRHLEGNLKGMETTEKTFAGFELGKIYSCCVTGNRYEIVNIEHVEFTA